MRKKRNRRVKIKPTELLIFSLALGSTFVFDKHIYRIQRSGEREVNTTKIEILFSPKGGCTKRICEMIDNAEHEIYVHAYSFTSEPIAKALLRAEKRGVYVYLIVDYDQYKEGKVPFSKDFERGLTDFTIDNRHGKAHSKYMVIDGKNTITGSFNFDKNAEERNREDVGYISNAPKTAEAHIMNWCENKEKIIKYKKKKK